MVGRAFLDALRFGASGGAAFGAAMGFLLEDVIAADAMGVVVGLCVGAVVGGVTAYPALITGSIGADMAGRWWGTCVTFLVALVCLMGATLAIGASVTPVRPFALGVAIYAGIVAWFRIPKILAP